MQAVEGIKAYPVSCLELEDDTHIHESVAAHFERMLFEVNLKRWGFRGE